MGSKKKDTNNLENLINHITQFDKFDEPRGSIINKDFQLNDNFDTNMSMSSQALNSFLNDFDLNRKSNIKKKEELDDINDEDSHFCLESRRNSNQKA